MITTAGWSNLFHKINLKTLDLWSKDVGPLFQVLSYQFFEVNTQKMTPDFSGIRFSLFLVCLVFKQSSQFRNPLHTGMIIGSIATIVSQGFIGSIF